MALTRSFITFAALLLSVAVLSGQQKIKSVTRTVPLFVTVTDEAGRLVPDLALEDFEVYDNGKKQTLTVFENKSMPIGVIVMLDTSGSMTLILDLVKAAAEQFLIRLFPEDVGRLGAFNDKIQFLPKEEFTSARDPLIGLLKDLDFGYDTRMWDALDEGIRRLQGLPQRKVILVFTDGEDTKSRRDMQDVMQQARKEEVMVYSIGLNTEYFSGQRMVRSNPDKGLKKLSEETGGGYFYLKHSDELGPTFTRVAQELHSQYVLGFSPAVLDGKLHELTVKLKKPGMVPRARKTYLASVESVPQ